MGQLRLGFSTDDEAPPIETIDRPTLKYEFNLSMKEFVLS